MSSSLTISVALVIPAGSHRGSLEIVCGCWYFTRACLVSPWAKTQDSFDYLKAAKADAKESAEKASVSQRKNVSGQPYISAGAKIKSAAIKFIIVTCGFFSAIGALVLSVILAIIAVIPHGFGCEKAANNLMGIAGKCWCFAFACLGVPWTKTQVSVKECFKESEANVRGLASKLDAAIAKSRPGQTSSKGVP